MALRIRTQLFSALALGLPAVTAAAQQGAPDLATRQVWIDFDLDGLDDLYALAPGRDDVLLRNLGDGGFADVTPTVGLAGQRSALVCPADFDQDGSRDLLLVARDGSLDLWRGLAGGSFQTVTVETGLADAPAVLRAEWVDYDRDGWIDLKLETRANEPMFFHNRGGMGFEPIELRLAASGAVRTLGLEPGASAESPVRDSDSETLSASDSGLGGSSQSSAVGGVTVGGISGGPGGMSSGSGGAFCAPLIQDTATSSCLSASSVPALGLLYPISQNLFVDPVNGRVGVNTTTPVARLDVIGGARISAGLTVTGNPLDLYDNRLRMFESVSGVETVFADPTGTSNGGEIRLRTDGNDSNVELYGDAGNDDGMLVLREASSLSGVVLRARDFFGSGEGALLNLFNPAGQASARLAADDGAGSGQLQLRNGAGGNNFVAANLEAESASGALLELYNTAGNRTVELSAQTDTTPAALVLREDDNSSTVLLDDAGITCFDSAGIETLEFDRQTGHAKQPIAADGLVKVALRVADNGNVLNSFNHVPNSTISVTHVATGIYRIDFGTSVISRFLTVTPADLNPRKISARFTNSSTIEVRSYSSASSAVNTKFSLLLY